MGGWRRKFMKEMGYARLKAGEEARQAGRPPDPGQILLTEHLGANLEVLRKDLGTSKDIIFREFRYGENSEYKAALIYVDGLVNSDAIVQSIMHPMMLSHRLTEYQESTMSRTLDGVRQTLLCSGEVSETQTMGGVIDGCLNGDTVLLAEGFDKALVIGTKGWEKRNVAEPESESVVRGPRECFTENFRTNTALLRRRIKTSRLRMEHMVIGEKSATNVCVAYIDGVADPHVVDTVKARLNNIVTDSVLDSGYLEQAIEDRPFSIFPTIGYTEKPDVAAAKMLEGRVAIVSDGSPFVLTAPMVFVESFQTAEDYYVRPLYASLIRLMRYMAFFLTVFAPAMYIAFTTFHQELIPTTLLFTIAAAREGTPFPALVEALVMVLSFEVLREAGLRLPRPVGQAISIVGALIMGDAAVSAGLVGAPMVITVAITAVAGFILPSQNESVTVLRLLMMFLGAAWGGYGITLGFLAILVHLASLRSFGVEYGGWLAFTQNMQDSYIRMPLWSMRNRPAKIARHDVTRRVPQKPPTVAAAEESTADAGEGGESS